MAKKVATSELVLQNETDFNIDNQPITHLWHYIKGVNSRLPAHWSVSRDIALRQEVYANEYLSSILLTVQTHLGNTRFNVQSTDSYVGAYIKLAREYDALLKASLHRNNTLDKFIQDILICDNGGFMLILGEQPIDQPVIGMPTGLMHIDSTRVQRTPLVDKPYLYLHTDNVYYFVHESRMINLTQFPSADREMLGVGLSNASRIFRLGEHISSLTEYEDEMLNGFSSESVLYGTSVKSEELEKAFKAAELQSVNSGRNKVGKRVYIGLRNENAKLGLLNLKNLPSENFDKRNDVEITLTMLALASGVSPTLLYDSVKSGSTKASSNTSVKQGEGKVLQWFINKFIAEINRAFLPESLKLSEEDRDDSDGTASKIKLTNAQRREVNLNTQITTIRTEREMMLKSGEIDQLQFERLELESGRLVGGLPISSIFSTNETSMKNLLFFVENPLDFEKNDYETVKPKIIEYIRNSESLALNGKTVYTQRLGYVSLYALKWVLDQYEARQQSLIETPDVALTVTDSNQYQDELNTLSNDKLVGTNKKVEDKKPVVDVANVNTEDVVTKSFTTNSSRELRKNTRSVFKNYKNGIITKEEVKKSLSEIYEKDIDNILGNKIEEMKLSELYKLVDELLLEYIC